MTHHGIPTLAATGALAVLVIGVLLTLLLGSAGLAAVLLADAGVAAVVVLAIHHGVLEPS